MTRPRFSFLLPVRNAAATLEEALASLTAQTIEDHEILVHDDGSTDASAEIAGRAAREDARIHVATLPPRGIVPALNALAARAKGDHLVRMDADDVSLPDRLAVMAEALRAHPEARFLGSRIRYVPRETLGQGLRRYEAWINGVLTHDDVLLNRFVECPLPHPTWMIRREVFGRLGGYREGPFPEDYELFLRAARAGVRFHKVPEVLLHWRDHPGRMSRTDDRFHLDRFFALKVEHASEHLRTLDRPLAIAGAGPDGKRWAKALGTQGLPPRYFLEVHPGRLGQTIHGAAVLGYDELSRLGRAFVLGAVGKAGGRDEIRRRLEAAGRAEGVDFLCVQ